MRDKKNIFKYYENPSYLNIHIQNQKTLVKISYENRNGLIFKIEFSFKGISFKKELINILNTEKRINSDEIEFEGIVIPSIDKNRIAQFLNEIMDYLYN